MSSADRPGLVPADPAAEPHLQAFVTALKNLRQRSGTLTVLMEKTGKSKTTLSTATNGKILPPWKLTLLITRACDGDEEQIKQLWIAAATATGLRPVPAELTSAPPPDPSTAHDAAEFVALLADLRRWAGLSLTVLNERADEGTALPRSTVHDMVQRGKRGKLPDVEMLAAYCKACGLDHDQIDQWVTALDTLKSAQLEDADAAAAAAASRPTPSASNRFVRGFRRLAGVDEEFLDQVPQERARYTILATAVAAAALLTAIEFAISANEIIRPSGWEFWGMTVAAVVAGLYSLITQTAFIRQAATYGSGQRRIWSALPSMGVSVVLSSLIVTGLLMAIFKPAIRDQVLTDRAHQMTVYEVRLRNCNPVVPAATVPRGCAGYSVTSGAVTLLQAQAATLERQRASLQAQINAAEKRIQAAEEIARLECAGIAGASRSGTVGEGPNCRLDRVTADRVRVDSHLDQLQGSVGGLDKQATNSVGGLSKYVSEAINRKLAARKARLHDRISTLEKSQAVIAIGDRNYIALTYQAAVEVATVLIAILPFLLIANMAGTEYEKILKETRSSALRTAAARRQAEATKSLQMITDLTARITDHLDQRPMPNSEHMSTDLIKIQTVLEAIQARLTELAATTASSRRRARRSRRPVRDNPSPVDSD
jgi:hypothetical protein